MPSCRVEAWKAAALFALVSQAAAPNDPNNAAIDLGKQTLELAFAASPTPPQAVGLIAHQTDAAKAADGLCQIVLQGDEAVRPAAVVALVNLHASIDKPLAPLAAADREELGNRLYLAITGKVPTALRLLRDPTSPSTFVAWFGQQLTAGKLPEPGTFAAGFGGEDKLFELIVGKDDELALVPPGPWSRRSVAMRRTPTNWSRASCATNQKPEALKSQWVQSKQAIYGQKLQAVAGNYNLVLRVYAKDAIQGTGPETGTPGMGGMPPGGPGMMPPPPMPPGGPGMMPPPPPLPPGSGAPPPPGSPPMPVTPGAPGAPGTPGAGTPTVCARSRPGP